MARALFGTAPERIVAPFWPWLAEEQDDPRWQTREAWLTEAARGLAAVIEDRAAPVTVPRIRMSCGFPKGSRGAVIGQCWTDKVSSDGTHEIFVSPVLDDPVRVLDVLAHEMCHAAVGIGHGHDRAFGKVARAIELEGPLTHTMGGEAFKRDIAGPLLRQLGAYPHARMVVRDEGGGTIGPRGPGGGGEPGESSGPRKQGTRLLKVKCPQCGYTVRVARRWLDVGAPECPNGECEGRGRAMAEEGADG